jgi:hypothetical protein
MRHFRQNAESRKMPSRADRRYRETSVIHSLGQTDGALLGIFRDSAFWRKS